MEVRLQLIRPQNNLLTPRKYMHPNILRGSSWQNDLVWYTKVLIVHMKHRQLYYNFMSRRISPGSLNICMEKCILT